VLNLALTGYGLDRVIQTLSAGPCEC
jgi:hypothetical protein